MLVNSFSYNTIYMIWTGPVFGSFICVCSGYMNVYVDLYMCGRVMWGCIVVIYETPYYVVLITIKNTFCILY